MDPEWSRRRVLGGGAAGMATILGGAAPGLAQVTDMEGLDGLWRDAEQAILAFFGPVDFLHEGVTLDLPQHADVGSSVPLTVRIESAMTEDDYPVVVHILAHRNPTPHVVSAWFRPEAGRAEFSTRIRLEISQKVTAVVQMSDGRHLRADREISVSFGACAQIGSGTQDEIYAFQPVPKVSVTPLAKRGDIVTVRALISHPMETGLRLNPFLQWIRERIISKFTCTYGGVEIFRTRPYPAIATNPYFQFYARAESSGTFDFYWYDSRDLSYTAQAAITVV
jgi:predicted secreted protein